MQQAKNVLGSLATLIGFVGVVLAAGTTVTTVTGAILDPRKRMGLVAAVSLCFGIAWCKSAKETATNTGLVDADGHTIDSEGQKNSTWLLLCIFGVCFLLTDLFIHKTGLVQLVKVDGPYFEVQPLSNTYERWPFPRRERDSGSQFADDQNAYQVDELQRLRDRPDIDNLEMLSVITKDNAAFLYDALLGEHFMFEVQKTSQTNSVIVEDIYVTVHDYEPIPKALEGAEGSAYVYNNYIVVIHLDRLGRELPWQFHAKLLLTNPAAQAVDLWQRKTIVLNDSQPLTFLVKVVAKQRGIYTYSATLVVKDNLTNRKQITLISPERPRKCMFED